jgi:phage gp36-like protein
VSIMYATKPDLEKRLGSDTLVSLADDNRDGVADDDVVNAVLNQASSKIDLYLSSRYAVPLTYVPSIIMEICVSLAVPLLFVRKREQISKEHIDFHEAAANMLYSLKTGEISLFGLICRTLAESTTLEKSKHFSPENLAEY